MKRIERVSSHLNWQAVTPNSPVSLLRYLCYIQEHGSLLSPTYSHLLCLYFKMFYESVALSFSKSLLLSQIRFGVWKHGPLLCSSARKDLESFHLNIEKVGPNSLLSLYTILRTEGCFYSSLPFPTDKSRDNTCSIPRLLFTQDPQRVSTTSSSPTYHCSSSYL